MSRTISVGAVPFDVLVAFDRVWVTAWEEGKLAVVNPRTRRVTRRVDVGARPVGLIARKGAVWVGFGRDATEIARVDPASVRHRAGAGSTIARPDGSFRARPISGSRRTTATSLHVDPGKRRLVRDSARRSHARTGRGRPRHDDLDPGQGAERRLPRRSPPRACPRLVPGRAGCIRRVAGVRIHVGDELRGE